MEAAGAALLHKAFPWGAHVTAAGGASFLSLHYQVIDEPSTSLGGIHKVTVKFESDDLSDAIAVVTLDRLEGAADSGELHFDDGGWARQPEVEDLHLLADPMQTFVGPQSPGEGKWIARMRLHQSWWRTFRLRVPFGTGPNSGSKKRYGNMLDAAGDEAGANFLTDEARTAYSDRRDRTKKGIDPFRTRRHLMASQTMAFNVFGHLEGHRDLAAGLLDALIGPGEVAEVTGIEIERLSSALGDRTAFDAFVTFRRPDTTAACIAIETKLTEHFSQTGYDWERYVAHSAFDNEVWNTADTTVLGDRRWSQLWRNHLLARAESAACDIGLASLLIVHHPQDPKCDTNVTDYCKLLNPGCNVQAVNLGRIHTVLTGLVAATDEAQQQWLADLDDRYLNLRLSEDLVPLARQ